MRRLIGFFTLVVLMAPPSFAQTARGFVEGAGGVAVSPDATSGDVLGEAGVRIAPHLFVFGDLGRFHNLQPSELQPGVDATTAAAAAGGLDIVGVARVPAWYSIGGLRVEVPTAGPVMPYIFGGAGVARLAPSAQFTYASGTLPNATPAVGDDVTSDLISLGSFSQLPATTAFTFAFGGGVDVPVARRVAVDVGYRFSRVAASTPLNAQSVTFGIGYRF